MKDMKRGYFCRLLVSLGCSSSGSTGLLRGIRGNFALIALGISCLSLLNISLAQCNVQNKHLLASSNLV